MSKKETSSYEVEGNNVRGIIIRNPHYRRGMAVDMARDQIAYAGQTEYRLIDRRDKTLVLSPEYLSDVRKLNPDKKGEHIIAIANDLQEASEIIIMRKPSRKPTGKK